MRLRLKSKYKVFIYIVLIIALICAICFELNLGHQNLKTKKVTYSKKGEMSYVTYVKDNNHYSDNYLKDEYNYVASLIDYFNLDYKYNYVLSEKVEYDLDYEIIANLEVYDVDNKTKPIEKKTYQILEKTNKKEKGQLIKVELYNQKIDYEKYNEIIQSWKKEISPEALLTITFKVNWKAHSNILNKEISDDYTIDFKIPISEKIINLSKPSPVDMSGVLYKNESLSTWIIVIMASTGIILLIALIGLINLFIKINKGKSKYEQHINKILREFDRAITEAKGNFTKKSSEHYIEVNDFMELLDVHDNLNEPIIYYKNASNTKSTFVVRNGKDIYYSVIKRDEYD